MAIVRPMKRVGSDLRAMTSTEVTQTLNRSSVYIAPTGPRDAPASPCGRLPAGPGWTRAPRVPATTI